MTPLHVMLAEAIARTRGKAFSHGLYLCQSDSAKHRYYAERLAAICEVRTFKIQPLVVPTGIAKHWKWAKQLASIRAGFQRDFGVSAVGELVAPTSVDKGLLALLAALSPEKLTTFDDGFINIDPSPPAEFVHTRWQQRLILELAGIHWWPERMRERSRLHYTVYRQANACQRVELIQLGRVCAGAVGEALPGERHETAAQAQVVVFLGPYPEVDGDVIRAFETAAQRLRPMGYLPHPRDVHGLLKNVPRIDTNLVAEDYVSQLIQESHGRQINVYGYKSSGLVNIAAIDGVRAINISQAGVAPADTDRMMASMGVSMEFFTLAEGTVSAPS